MGRGVIVLIIKSLSNVFIYYLQLLQLLLQLLQLLSIIFIYYLQLLYLKGSEGKNFSTQQISRSKCQKNLWETGEKLQLSK